MAKFELFEETYKKLEGSNYEPDDAAPGEGTRYGVSRGLYLSATGKKVDENFIKTATYEQLRVAPLWVWNKLQLGKVSSQDCADLIFYFAYNRGHNAVPCILQSFLAENYGFTGKVDGIVGSATTAAMVAAISKNEVAFHDAWFETMRRYYAGEPICTKCGGHKNCPDKYKGSNSSKKSAVWTNISNYFKPKQKSGDDAMKTLEGGTLSTYEVVAARVKNVANPTSATDWAQLAIVGGVVVVVLVMFLKLIALKKTVS